MEKRLVNMPSKNGISMKGEILKDILSLETLLISDKAIFCVEIVRWAPVVNVKGPAYILFVKTARLAPNEPER